jgi:phenylalanyl-tRNA synthetase beta chain
MKISIDWLKDYLDTDIPDSVAVETLERIGLMTESREEKEGDVILDIETYSNRPDTLGHLGMARELAAALGVGLKQENWPLGELSSKTSDVVDVQVWDEDLCPRYCGLVVKGVRVGPSPLWLRRRIEAMGLNPVNNVVDVTNYVLFATSQPIHAFDLAKLGGSKIIIRRAKKGEKLLCLDGTELALETEMLAIADASKPVALAGVIGGQESAVSEKTTDIFIESACFDPVSIRKTRKAAGIQTDASYRFERGADIAYPPQAARMAASLLSQFGGQAAGTLVDIYPQPRKKKEVILRHRRVAELLGVAVDEGFVKKTLEALEFSVELQQPGIWRIKVPTFRVDIDREADLIEEIARFFGYENIPSALPPLKIVPPIAAGHEAKLSRLSGLLLHWGFNEVINFSFSDPEKEAALDSGLQPVEIRNPISSKASLLRTVLLGGLMETAAWNSNRGIDTLRVFEVGNIFCRAETGCRECLSLGLLCLGSVEEDPRRAKEKEKHPEAGFFFLKGACEAALVHLRYEPFFFQDDEHPLFEQGRCLALVYREEKVGRLGRVRKKIQDHFGLRQDVYAAEFNLELLFGKQPRAFAYSPVPKFPAIIRDISLLIPDGISYQDVKRAVEKLSIPILEDFRLVDRYAGKSFPQGKVSLSFRFIYRHPQRTLLAEEVDKAEQQIINHLKRALEAQLR